MFLWLILMALTLWAPQAPAGLRSVYTGLGPRDCKTVSANRELAGSTQRCPGVAGYALLVEDADSRVSVTVVAPGGVKYELNYWQVVTTGFTTIGDKAEWRMAKRGRREVPVALIVRVNANDDPEHPDKPTSYLAVAKITPGQVCVTDKIGPGRDANEQARLAADGAAARPCLRAGG
jgi:hypothetical protein